MSFFENTRKPVSYTHLDVYKRQVVLVVFGTTGVTKGSPYDDK